MASLGFYPCRNVILLEPLDPIKCCGSSVMVLWVEGYDSKCTMLQCLGFACCFTGSASVLLLPHCFCFYAASTLLVESLDPSKCCGFSTMVLRAAEFGRI